MGETFFYRNQPQWKALQQHVIPELLQRHQKDREIRFWSAGCATGEEPYTLAIILNEVIPDLSSWQVDILATDVNPEFRDHRAGIGHVLFHLIDLAIRPAPLRFSAEPLNPLHEHTAVP